jgi:hypothetical protein
MAQQSWIQLSASSVPSQQPSPQLPSQPPLQTPPLQVPEAQNVPVPQLAPQLFIKGLPQATVEGLGQEGVPQSAGQLHEDSPNPDSQPLAPHVGPPPPQLLETMVQTPSSQL